MSGRSFSSCWRGELRQRCGAVERVAFWWLASIFPGDLAVFLSAIKTAPGNGAVRSDSISIVLASKCLKARVNRVIQCRCLTLGFVFYSDGCSIDFGCALREQLVFGQRRLIRGPRTRHPRDRRWLLGITPVDRRWYSPASRRPSRNERRVGFQQFAFRGLLKLHSRYGLRIRSPIFCGLGREASTLLVPKQRRFFSYPEPFVL